VFLSYWLLRGQSDKYLASPPDGVTIAREIYYYRRVVHYCRRHCYYYWADSPPNCRKYGPNGFAPNCRKYGPIYIPPSPRRNWSNWATNCYLIHHVLQIWLLFIFNLKKSLAGQKFESNEEVVAATGAYFADLEKPSILKTLRKRMVKEVWASLGQVYRAKRSLCWEIIRHFQNLLEASTYRTTLVLLGLSFF